MSAEKLRQSNTVCDPATPGGTAVRDQEDRGGSAENQAAEFPRRQARNLIEAARRPTAAGLPATTARGTNFPP
jgi:hypothetical protein